MRSAYVRGATRIPFSVSDTTQVNVDVGSGNATVTTKDVAVPGAKGALVPFGLRFDSLALGGDATQKDGAAGGRMDAAHGSGHQVGAE